MAEPEEEAELEEAETGMIESVEHKSGNAFPKNRPREWSKR